ncbi:CsgG/HfaB family protein [Deinococcus lacus]|uniref:CsgG/HfaB family protein n=1 Tax=Deinococcus lacus TaxID=392561 RepID=A0ABW1YEG3_9DEIO
MNKVIAFAVLTLGSALAQAPVSPAVRPGLPAGVPMAQPQVHITVGNIDCGNFSGCNGGMISQALTNAMMQAGHFAVYERASLDQGLKEGFLSAADAGSQVQGADVIVVGTVTAFGQGSASGDACFMGLCLGGQENRLGVNLRVFDVKTSRIIGTALVEGKSTGGSGSINYGGFKLGGSTNTGMDAALSTMLTDAVGKLTRTIPANYYR